MNYKNIRHIFLSSIVILSSTLQGASPDGKKFSTDEMIAFAGSGLAFVFLGVGGKVGWDWIQNKWTRESHEKRIQTIGADLHENKELSIGRLKEMFEQNSTSKRFVLQNMKEAAQQNKKELEKRIALWDQAQVKNRLTQITDEQEMQNYVQSIPEEIRREVASKITEEKQRVDELKRQKNEQLMREKDEAVREELHDIEQYFNHQIRAPQSKLKDAIVGDFGHNMRPIIDFSKIVQHKIGRLDVLLKENASPSVKKETQEKKDILVTLLRNTHVWLEPDMKRERVEQQDHEKGQIQLEADRAKKEYQLKKSRFITDTQAQLGKVVSDAQREIAEMSSKALQAAAVFGSQANLIDEKISRRFSDFATNLSTRFDALRKSQQEHHEETQTKLTEIQRVNLSNDEMHRKILAISERLEAQYRFDVQQRWQQQAMYAQPQYQQPIVEPSVPPMGL